MNFAGIEGRILSKSPHGNYIAIALSDRVTIVGTYSNKFNWAENEESGFKSFITYIGLSQETGLKQWIADNNGYFNENEGTPRKAKRVTGYDWEIKVRGLSVESVLELIGK
jgi:hypothetical protein